MPSVRLKERLKWNGLRLACSAMSARVSFSSSSALDIVEHAREPVARQSAGGRQPRRVADHAAHELNRQRAVERVGHQMIAERRIDLAEQQMDQRREDGIVHRPNRLEARGRRHRQLGGDAVIARGRLQYADHRAGAHHRAHRHAGGDEGNAGDGELARFAALDLHGRVRNRRKLQIEAMLRAGVLHLARRALDAADGQIGPGSRFDLRKRDSRQASSRRDPRHVAFRRAGHGFPRHLAAAMTAANIQQRC